MSLTDKQELEYYKLKLKEAGNKPKNNNPNNKRSNKKKFPGLKEFDSEIFFKGLVRYPFNHLIAFGVGMVAGLLL